MHVLARARVARPRAVLNTQPHQQPDTWPCAVRHAHGAPRCPSERPPNLYPVPEHPDTVGVRRWPCAVHPVPRTAQGEAACVGVDTGPRGNGNWGCYLKSRCDGKPGRCSGSWCGYRREGVVPPSPTCVEER